MAIVGLVLFLVGLGLMCFARRTEGLSFDAVARMSHN